MSIVTKESNPELYNALFLEDMSAEQMFEKLNYCFYRHENFIELVEWVSENHIWFSLIHKKIEINGDINMQELQAINKQVEELGWLDEQ